MSLSFYPSKCLQLRFFSNLGSPGDLYNSQADRALPIVGKSAPGTSELWFAVQFTPKVDVRAKVLEAAVGYTSGEKRIKLGLYTNDRVTHSVGRLVQGGEGSTAQIPDLGSCCQLARVTLPGEGATLKGGKRYWLVASSDDVNAPTFLGGWHLSNLAKSSVFSPGGLWGANVGAWPAAQIRGTRAQAIPQVKTANVESRSADANAVSAQVTIFTNLGPASTNLYNTYAGGYYVSGNRAADVSELWEALPFTAKTNSHATTLVAALWRRSGASKVNLGIYSDEGGKVGTLLPGGQGSTTEIPNYGECCALAQVTLPGAGVPLTAGTHYWLVASPDDAAAPDFEALWQFSNLAFGAYTEPENFTNWTTFTSLWLAAEIQGTSP